MGYEPLPVYRGKTLFGKEAVFYPNIFRYCSLFLVVVEELHHSSLDLVKHIHSIDGWTGLYRGFGCALTSKIICWYATTKVDEVSRSLIH